MTYRVRYERGADRGERTTADEPVARGEYIRRRTAGWAVQLAIWVPDQTQTTMGRWQTVAAAARRAPLPPLT